MPSVATLGVSIIARTQKFMRGMRNVQKRLRKFTSAVRVMAKRVAKFSLALSGLAIAAGLLFAKVVLAGERFNQKLRRSQAIMSGLNRAIRDDMKMTAFEVARVTKFSAEQAAESYFFLASAGLSAKQSIAALPQVAQFAQAGMFDMAKATDLLTDAQSALGLTVKDVQRNMENMRHVSDVLVKANTIANASVEQFSEALTNKAGASLRDLNKDIEEGVAILAAFADQGIKGAEAGTALAIVLRELSAKAVINAKQFKKFNIEVFKHGRMRHTIDILADLEDALSDMGQEQKIATLLQLGFTLKSMSYLKAILGLSRGIGAYDRALRRAGGITQRVADKQLTPFEKALARITAAWVRLSDAMQPALTAVSFGITALANKLEGLTDKLTPEKLTAFLIRTLNSIDLFFRKIALNITANVRMIAVIFKDIIGSIPFVDVPESLKSAVARIKASEARQRGFQAALSSGNPLMQIAAMADLLGTKIGIAIAKPMEKAMADFTKEQSETFKHSVLDLFDKVGFEVTRIFENPGRALTRLLGFGPKPGPMGRVAAAGRPSRQVQFAEISLARTAISGLGLKRKEQQLVHDPANDRIVQLMVRQNSILQTGLVARTAP